MPQNFEKRPSVTLNLDFNFQDHGVTIDALELWAQLMRDLFAIAKFFSVAVNTCFDVVISCSKYS